MRLRAIVNRGGLLDPERKPAYHYGDKFDGSFKETWSMNKESYEADNAGISKEHMKKLLHQKSFTVKQHGTYEIICIDYPSKV